MHIVSESIAAGWRNGLFSLSLDSLGVNLN